MANQWSTHNKRDSGSGASEEGRKPGVVMGRGGNLPLDVLCVLSEWVSVLEARGTVPGACVADFSWLFFLF
jgi:hypothetical protein